MIVVAYQRTQAGALLRAAQRGRVLVAELPVTKHQPAPIAFPKPRQTVKQLVTPRDHFNRIIDLVARMHGSTFAAVMSQTEKARHSHARQAAICALREAYPLLAVAHLCRVLGDFDNSMVYHAMRRRGYREKNPKWKCGHPRTEENTRNVGGVQLRCKICRQVTERRSQAKRRPPLPATRICT